jgi:hypothetical protein
VLILTLAAACNQQSASTPGETPQLDTPAPESEPSRAYTAANDAARTTTGNLTVSTSLRLPDAGSNSDAQEVLTLHGANGLNVEAQITGAVSPATQVEGQTLRGLFAIPVEEPQVLVYRVTAETKAPNGQGLCNADNAAFVVVWDPETPGESGYKVLGLLGGAPGAAGARACPMLEYHGG